MGKKRIYSLFSLDDMAMLVVEIICKQSIQEVRQVTDMTFLDVSHTSTVVDTSLLVRIILVVHYHICTSLTTIFIGKDLKYI